MNKKNPNPSASAMSKEGKILITSFLVIVATLLVIVSLVIKSSASEGPKTTYKKLGWRYYDDCMAAVSAGEAEVDEHPRSEEYTNIEDPDDTLRVHIETARKSLRKSFGKYADLDWEHFENVEFKVCDFPEFELTAIALYSIRDDLVYCNRNVMKNYDDDVITNTIVHELIHVLTMPGNRTNIDEALTVYLSKQVYPCDYTTYPFSYMLIERYLERHDMKEAINFMREGTLISKVEEDIGAVNVLTNTNGLYESANSGAYNNTMMFVVIDIYAHYIANTGGLDDASMYNLNLVLSCLTDTPEAREAIKYFEEVLDV